MSNEYTIIVTINQKEVNFVETHHCLTNVFDYIIIGAGTAGGIIAKKLTDDKKTSVLVIEAGTNMSNESPSIAAAELAANDNRLSYNILSSTQQNIGRQIRLRAGRVIGGSSHHSFMAAIRGSSNLYDLWANIAGNQWSYESVRPLFIENETYTGNTQSPSERGTEGPIFIRQQIVPASGLKQTLTEAISQVLGIPIVEDYNTGISACTYIKGQSTQKEVDGDFVRSSTATGYLNEAVVIQGNEFNADEFGVGRRKLAIFAKATADKIILKEENGIEVAVGVKFVKDGVSLSAFARNEVIVCAGIFSSVILQRSGIGKSVDLAKAGIPTLVESPNVGYNFQTQYFAAMGVEVETKRLLQVLAADPIPLTIAAFNTDDGLSRRLQYLGLPLPSLIPIQDVFINNWGFNPDNTSNIMSIAISDLNPKSRGSIIITHSDPEAYPSINFNPLVNTNDLNYMIDKYIETYKIIQRALEIDPDGIYKVVYPSEDIFKMTDEAKKRNILAEYVRASYTNFDHYGGQCKMGANIQEGVVDGFLNVYGTKDLRVADLSIAPILPDGNTSIPAQMIGLNAVRFIKHKC